MLGSAKYFWNALQNIAPADEPVIHITQTWGIVGLKQQETAMEQR